MFLLKSIMALLHPKLPTVSHLKIKVNVFDFVKAMTCKAPNQWFSAAAGSRLSRRACEDTHCSSPLTEFPAQPVWGRAQ